MFVLWILKLHPRTNPWSTNQSKTQRSQSRTDLWIGFIQSKPKQVFVVVIVVEIDSKFPMETQRT